MTHCDVIFIRETKRNWSSIPFMKYEMKIKEATLQQLLEPFQNHRSSNTLYYKSNKGLAECDL